MQAAGPGRSLRTRFGRRCGGCNPHARERLVKLAGNLLALGFAAAASGCGPSDSEFIEFSTYRSPDGDYTVVVDYAHSMFAFGPETVRVFVMPRGSRARNHIVTTKISNDGGITAENIKAQWKDKNTIEFCMSGVEQEDSVLIINLHEHSYSEVKKKCAGSPGN